MAADAKTTDATEDLDDTIPDPAETANRGKDADRDNDEEKAALKAENDRIKKALSEANRKAAADRKRLEEIDKQEEEKRTAQLSEVEREKRARLEAERRASEAEDRARSAEESAIRLRINMDIIREATEQGFIYPEDVPNLVASDPRIQFDPEADKVAGVKDAVKALGDKRPLLKGTPQGRTAGTPPRPGGHRATNGRREDDQPPPYEDQLRSRVKYPI